MGSELLSRETLSSSGLFLVSVLSQQQSTNKVHYSVVLKEGALGDLIYSLFHAGHQIAERKQNGIKAIKNVSLKGRLL